MNTYRFTFHSSGSGEDEIEYAVTIRTPRLIPTEELRTACLAVKDEMLEKIADRLFELFGGDQVVRGNHGGVAIKAERP